MQVGFQVTKEVNDDYLFIDSVSRTPHRAVYEEGIKVLKLRAEQLKKLQEQIDDTKTN